MVEVNVLSVQEWASLAIPALFAQHAQPAIADFILERFDLALIGVSIEAPFVNVRQRNVLGGSQFQSRLQRRTGDCSIDPSRYCAGCHGSGRRIAGINLENVIPTFCRSGRSRRENIGDSGIRFS